MWKLSRLDFQKPHGMWGTLLRSYRSVSVTQSEALTEAIATFINNNDNHILTVAAISTEREKRSRAKRLRW